MGEERKLRKTSLNAGAEARQKVQEKRALKEEMCAKEPEHLYLREQVGEGWEVRGEPRCEDGA